MGTGKQRTALIAGVALLSAGNAASAQTVKDAGGNTYNTVAIGTQVWTKENLNYKVAGSFYYKDDSVANAATYGRVYTQFAAKTACPTAWHLPSLAEWTTLADFLGGSATAGGKMKSAGTAAMPGNLASTTIWCAFCCSSCLMNSTPIIFTNASVLSPSS